MDTLSHFSGVIGHEAICRLLEASIDKPASAYLFIGPEHIGKTTVAEVFMKGILGLSQTENLSSHPDFFTLTLLEEKKLISVEQVREFRERASMRPVRAMRSVFFIPQADRLNEQGMNALLKTIEEPPANAVFVLLAEDESRVPKTIQSRSVVLHFQRVAIEQLTNSLMKQGKTHDESNVCAKLSRGLPGLVLGGGSQVEDPQIELLVRQLVEAEKLGQQLASIEEMTKWAEAQPEPLSVWNEILLLAMRRVALPSYMETEKGYRLALGLSQAMKQVGSAISPRLALEAACAGEGLSLVSHLPRPLSVVYLEKDL